MLSESLEQQKEALQAKTEADAEERSEMKAMIEQMQANLIAMNAELIKKVRIAPRARACLVAHYPTLSRRTPRSARSAATSTRRARSRSTSSRSRTT